MYYIIGLQVLQFLILVICLPLFFYYMIRRWQASALLLTKQEAPPDLSVIEGKLSSLEVRAASSSVNLEKQLRLLSDSVGKVPNTVLRTIQGSVNSTSGKLGELVQFIELQRAYDRLIPVGNIVDFIAVRFPTEDSPGVVHFIDVKTGKRAVLSKDQKKLRAIVQEGLVEFHTVKMEVT